MTFSNSQIPFSQKQQTITENESEQNEEIEYHAKANSKQKNCYIICVYQISMSI